MGGLTDSACTGWCGIGVRPTNVSPPRGGTEGGGLVAAPPPTLGSGVDGEVDVSQMSTSEALSLFEACEASSSFNDVTPRSD